MADFTTNKVTGSQLTAAEWNQMADVDNFTSSSDQTPATGDLNQIGKGVAAYTGQAGIYTTDSGAADAYVVTQVSPFKAPHKFFVGLTIRFRTSNTNTGACTINPFTLGVKNIKLDDGSTDPSPGDISTTKENVVVYDGTVFRLKKEITGKVIQVVNTLTGATSASGGNIPFDDTIPKNTEGGEFMTLAITPTSSTNKLKIDVVFNYGQSSVTVVTVALFQDSVVNALAGTSKQYFSGGVIDQQSFTYYMTAGTTSSTTFKVRAGGVVGTTQFNGQFSGSRRLGGVMASSITITEIQV